MDALRLQILLRVAAHEATGASTYLDDSDLAAAIGVSVEDVQPQIRILETEELHDVTAEFGPKYAVRLTPKGELAVENATAPPQTPPKPVGF